MNRILRQFLVVCIVILLLSVSTAFLLRGRALNAMEDKCADLAQAQMTRIREKIDALLSDALNVGRQLAYDELVLTLCGYSDPITEPAAQIRLLEARDLLRTAQTFNDRYPDILLYSASSHLVVTSQYAFLDYDRFYGDFFQYDDMDAASWQTQVFEAPYTSRVFPAAEIQSYVNYRSKNSSRCVPMGLSLQSGRGKIVVLIPETLFPILPEDLFPGYDCHLRIYDQEGVLILGDNTPAEARDIVLNTASSSLGLRYELVVSALSIQRELAGFGQILATMIISQLLLLFAFGALTAWRDVFPVRRLLNALPPTEQINPQKADYRAICSRVSSMAEHNAQLSSQLITQTPIVESWLTLDWLNGRFEDERALEQAFSRMRLSFPSSLCWGLMVAAFSPSPAASALENTLQALRRLKSDHLWFAQTDESHIAVLYGYPPGEEAAGDARIRGVQALMMQRVSELHETPPSFAVHAPVYPHEIPERLISLYRLTENQKTDEDHCAHLRYSLATEKRLIGAVCGGNLRECQSILSKLLEDNAEEENRSRLYQALCLTQARILETSELSLNAPPSPQTDAELLSWFESICRHIAPAEEEANGDEAIHPIALYILEHYDDKNMSLNLLSDQFGVSETYLSRRFKEVVGYNYTTFLEKVRIEHACDLLNNGMTVETVSGMVGYNSVHVFRSAFKRVMGVTPSHFRFPSDR